MGFIFVKSKVSKKADSGSVYTRIRNRNANRKYAVGFCILLKEWELYRTGKYNADSVMESIGIRYGTFANTLERIRQEVIGEMDGKAAKVVIDNIRKAAMDEFHGVRPLVGREAKHMLLDYLTACIEDYRHGRRTKRGTAERVSESVISNFVTLRKNLLLFENTVNHQWTLDEIDMTFQQKFVSWCIEKGLLTSTIHNFTTLLKVLMNLAFEERLTHNDGFMRADFVTRLEDIEQVFLTLEQITQLMTLDISSKEKILQLMAKVKSDDLLYVHEEDLTPRFVQHIQQSRDIFIVGCLTGQRYSDYNRLDKSMIVTIKQQKFLKIYQTKTRKLVYIPLDYRVEEILDKYGGVLPSESLQNVNLIVKFLGELLGWTYHPNIDRHRLGRKSGLRFCDMLSSHTARRSFATNAYAQGVPLASIMAITGHSREEKLRIYLKLQAEDKALLAAKDFKGLLQML